jgi:hypothetical protein
MVVLGAICAAYTVSLLRPRAASQPQLSG